MPEEPALHTDRRRAESFGAAAQDYDRYRPRYPRALIDGLVEGVGERALDVGAGTGIASVQLMDAGARILAVEPDARMAQLAAAKGVDVEQATFEEWQPAGRTFDLVVFAQSFHWVRPRPAVEKVASLLTPGGRLALLWNRITPISPTNAELNEIYRDYLGTVARPSVDAEERITTILADCGFTVEERHVAEERRYTAEDWLNQVFTYSNHLTLQPVPRSELRARLQQRIGTAGVAASNDALAVVGTLRG
jgi:SAM-dependent methyltransferase